MPRDLLRQLLHERIDANRDTLRGQILTMPRFIPYDAGTAYMPVCDVLLEGTTIVSAVPIAAANQELRYATIGSPVRLSRSSTGRVEVIGLDKRGIGNVYNYTVSLTPLTTLSAAVGIVVTSGATSGFSSRILTYGELASATTGGYGETPYGAWALTQADGTIINVIP